MKVMNTPTRDLLRRPDTLRRRSARQALATIPNGTTATPSPGEMLPEVNDNLLNTRNGVDSASPVPSPDELVIQKRGRRRKTIVWSPDLEACKRDSLFSLSSRDRTPVKSPSKSSMVLRSTPRKRLALGDTNESQFTTPEKKKRSQQTSERSSEVDTGQRHFTGNLINGLQGLSHEQLVKMIMDLVTMQESGMIRSDEKIRNVILRKMPVADIRPLQERLSNLRQNVYASLVSFNLDDSAYNRAYVHLDTYQKTLVEQGAKLLESQHWISVMEYVFTAWDITKDLPEWKNQGFDNIRHKCFKSLTQFCMQALKNGSFTEATLNFYADRFKTLAGNYEEIYACLQLIKEAKQA